MTKSAPHNPAALVIGCFELALSQEDKRLTHARNKRERLFKSKVGNVSADELRAADNAVDIARERFNAACAAVSALRTYAKLIGAE